MKYKQIFCLDVGPIPKTLIRYKQVFQNLKKISNPKHFWSQAFQVGTLSLEALHGAIVLIK
jgi:hypothetical protein